MHRIATTPSGPGCSPTSHRPRLIILPKKLVITFTQPALVCLSHLQAVLQLATCPLLTYLLQSSSNASQTHQAHFILRTCQIVEHNFAGTKTRHIDQLFAKVHKWLRKLRKEGKCLSSVPKICASVSQGLQLGESDQSGKSESAPNAWIKKVKVIKTARIIK